MLCRSPWFLFILVILVFVFCLSCDHGKRLLTRIRKRWPMTKNNAFSPRTLPGGWLRLVQWNDPLDFYFFFFSPQIFPSDHCSVFPGLKRGCFTDVQHTKVKKFWKCDPGPLMLFCFLKNEKYLTVIFNMWQMRFGVTSDIQVTAASSWAQHKVLSLVHFPLCPSVVYQL